MLQPEIPELLVFSFSGFSSLMWEFEKMPSIDPVKDEEIMYLN